MTAASAPSRRPRWILTQANHGLIVACDASGAHRLRDGPSIGWTGWRLRMGWYAMPGAVGLRLWTLPLQSLLTVYAAGRAAFGALALLAPAVTGKALAGEGGATPDAQAFLRGMGGREIGLGLGLWGAMRAQRPTRPWLVAGVLSDGSDMAGIVGAWQHMAPSKR